MTRTDLRAAFPVAACALALSIAAAPVQAQVFDISGPDSIETLVLPDGDPARCEHVVDDEALGAAGLAVWLDVEMATSGNASMDCRAFSNGNVVRFEVGPEPWRVGTICVLNGEERIAVGPRSHSGAGYDTSLIASIWPEEMFEAAGARRSFVAQSDCRLLKRGDDGAPVPTAISPSMNAADACLQPGRYLMDFAFHTLVGATSTASGDVIGWTRTDLRHGSRPGTGPSAKTSGVALQVLGAC